VIAGGLLAESIRVGASLEGVPLRVVRIWRADAGDPDAGQPRTWTFIDFEVEDDMADALASALSEVLAPGSWYCDFRSDSETFVVFKDRVFRYRRRDAAGRSEVERYARSVGVPEAQLDWPE